MKTAKMLVSVIAMVFSLVLLTGCGGGVTSVIDPSTGQKSYGYAPRSFLGGAFDTCANTFKAAGNVAGDGVKRMTDQQYRDSQYYGDIGIVDHPAVRVAPSGPNIPDRQVQAQARVQSLPQVIQSSIPVDDFMTVVNSSNLVVFVDEQQMIGEAGGGGTKFSLGPKESCTISGKVLNFGRPTTFRVVFQAPNAKQGEPALKTCCPNITPVPGCTWTINSFNSSGELSYKITR